MLSQMFPWYNEVRRFFREHPNFDRRDFWFNVALFLTTQEIELAIRTKAASISKQIEGNPAPKEEKEKETEK